VIGAAFLKWKRVITMNFISRKDVLKLFSISVWTLRRWEKQRGFPEPIRVTGAIRMYVKSEVDTWVLSGAIVKATKNGIPNGA
jgi:predicted DNA-binding transcriptional regulator AlpA